MRLIKALISVALVADAALASSWFTKAGKFGCPGAFVCNPRRKHTLTRLRPSVQQVA